MNRQNRVLLTLAAISVACFVRPVLAHGPSEKDLVAIIFALEQVCKSEISGFEEEAGSLFINWKKEADTAISRAKQSEFVGGKTFEEAVAQATESFRKEPQARIQELCTGLLRDLRMSGRGHR